MGFFSILSSHLVHICSSKICLKDQKQSAIVTQSVCKRQFFVCLFSQNCITVPFIYRVKTYLEKKQTKTNYSTLEVASVVIRLPLVVVRVLHHHHRFCMS